MYGRLRVAIPGLQVLLVVAVFVCRKFTHGYLISVRYVEPAWDLVVRKLNFPLVAFWAPLAYLAERFSGGTETIRPATRIAETILLGLALLLSVALFWYLAVVEVEKRRHGKGWSFGTSPFLKASKMSMLFVVGLAAFAYAFLDTRQLMLYGRSKIQVYTGGLLLLAWGVVLVGMAVADALALARGRTSTTG